VQSAENRLLRVKPTHGAKAVTMWFASRVSGRVSTHSTRPSISGVVKRDLPGSPSGSRECYPGFDSGRVWVLPPYRDSFRSSYGGSPCFSLVQGWQEITLAKLPNGVGFRIDFFSVMCVLSVGVCFRTRHQGLRVWL
jgi:hypothetical protein